MRAICVTLGAGAVIGIMLGIMAMGAPQLGARLICAMAVLMYLTIGAAAVGLWFGEDLGLQWTRLLLLAQIPVIQSTGFTYVFYTGAIGLLYGGSEFGLRGLLGSSFMLAIRPGATSEVHFIIGANVLAIAMLGVLLRVDLMPSPQPPPLPRACE
ncbi:hypothetical protein B0E46_11320 [Rhodanobacter sp. B04]|uniref:hypothetical protein n=1 Tax=Rhodanobacter sp. B04 TaxID=1945860 RepID=UPI00098781C5|nr:hypothetical protein [Rhodanobacter sp. B04]OOG62813.1 hypothetical protein B0E46_11320 [Rhodanobacter sp. B04]